MYNNQVFNLLIPIEVRGNIMNNRDKSVLKSISRRNLLVWLGIFLGIILIGISIIKEKAIRTINRFRIRSIEQIPQFGGFRWCDIPYLKERNMVKKDFEGRLGDWGLFASLSAGYSISEGTEQDIALRSLKYCPYLKFKMYPILLVEQAMEIVKKLSQA